MFDPSTIALRLGASADVFTRQQVVAAGLTDEWIEAQLAAHRVRRLHRKVYLLTTGAPTQRQRERAALLSAGPRAALSHDTAARRHGLTLPGGGNVHVTVPYGASADPRPGVVLHRSRAFHHIVVDRTDLPTVSPTDTCLDLAVAADDARSGMRMILHAALGMRVPPARLRSLLEVRRPARYRRALVDAVRLLDEGVTSTLEARYEIGDRTLTVRLDGWRYHSDRRVALTDRARDNAAELAGRSRLTYGWEELHDPCTTACEIAAALYRIGWSGPSSPVTCACVPVPRPGNART